MERKEQFMAAMKGVDARFVAMAMSALIPGHNFIGCPKGLMALSWADPGRLGRSASPDLSKVFERARQYELSVAKDKVDRSDLCKWIAWNVLNEKQLDIVPLGQKFSIRELIG